MSPARPSSGLRILAILVLSVGLVASVSVGVLASILPRPFFPPPPPLAVESVSLSPDPPQPYLDVTVTAVLSRQGTAVVRLAYVASFASTASGSVPMTSAAPRTYRALLGSFLPGTEVWFVVAVTMGDLSAESNLTVFQVGTVVRGGASGLRIASVDWAPSVPGPGSMFAVTATVTTANGSYSPEAVVEVLATASGGAFGQSYRMDALNMTTYRATAYAFPGSRLMFRVAAQDTTGNTAVSGVFTLLVPDFPRPVP